jgi:predicted metal-binding membrane protein
VVYNPRESARVRNPVLLATAAAWTLLLAGSGGAGMFAHCAVVDSQSIAPPASFRMLLAMNPPASLAAGWALMLVAMMAPALIPPVRHIRLRSFAHRRARSIALFVAAYGAIWMAAGGVLLAIDLAAKASATQSYLPAACLLLVALVWQCSPLKQRCLNRGHAHRELAAFGIAADLAALRFGVTHGVWCAASCWALMLFPMLLPQGHIVAMAAVTVLVFGERLEQPMPPRWRWRGIGKLERLVVAQARIRLQVLRLGSAPFSSSAKA